MNTNNYFLRRLLLIIPTLFGITVVCFTIIQFVPGGPVEQFIQNVRGQMTETGEAGGGTGELQEEGISEAEIEAIKKRYNFDKPVVVRYFLWIGDLLTLDLGTSYMYEKPVTTLIAGRLQVSLTFGLVSFFLSYLICIPLGIVKAIRHNTKFDHISTLVVFTGYTIPGFVLGVLLLVFFGGGSFWNVFPLGGIRSDHYEELNLIQKAFDYAHHMVLPILCYVLGNFALLTLLMKNTLIAEINKDYVRTAIAKGLSYREAILKHAFRNALIPIMTGIGGVLMILFAGSLLVENVFNINGIGRLGYEAIVNRDYPVVLGLLIVQALLALLGRVLSDFAYVIVDPRINFNKSSS